MSKFKFTVGPWNVHTGADSYGPETRKAIDLETKFARFAELGFSAVQFHDDDAVPNMNNLTEEEIKAEARKVKAMLDKYGLAAEFVAPRLWMDPHTRILTRRTAASPAPARRTGSLPCGVPTAPSTLRANWAAT